jgi:hypothetical protein
MHQLSNGVLICLECMDRFQLEQTAARIHFLLGKVESIAGVPYGGIGPHVQIPRVPDRQPITFNNIRVDRSVVGAINTDQAQAIEAALSHAKQSGDPVFSELFQELAQAVLDNSELDQAKRKAIIEQLSFLISQLLAKPQQKRPAIVGAVLKSVTEALSAFSSLVTLWEKLQPLLRQALS